MMLQGISPTGASFEALCAQQDVQAALREYGQTVTMHIRTEANVVRDNYNSIQDRPTDQTPVTAVFCAYPVQYQPSEKQLEKAGLREKVDVSIQTAVLDWTDAGWDFTKIDIKRTTVIVDGEEYEIRDKGRVSQFQNVWLYYSLGLSKR